MTIRGEREPLRAQRGVRRATRRGLILGWIALVCFATFVMLQVHYKAQKPERETQQWTIRSTRGNWGDVRVIDTAGVCLYYTYEGIAAVPKSQLPVGTGCQ